MFQLVDHVLARHVDVGALREGRGVVRLPCRLPVDVCLQGLVWRHAGQDVAITREPPFRRGIWLDIGRKSAYHHAPLCILHLSPVFCLTRRPAQLLADSAKVPGSDVSTQDQAVRVHTAGRRKRSFCLDTQWSLVSVGLRSLQEVISISTIPGLAAFLSLSVTVPATLYRLVPRYRSALET